MFFDSTNINVFVFFTLSLQVWFSWKPTYNDRRIWNVLAIIVKLFLAGKSEHHTKLQSYKNELNHEIGPFGLYFNQNHSHLHPRNCSTLQRSNEMKKTLRKNPKVEFQIIITRIVFLSYSYLSGTRE